MSALRSVVATEHAEQVALMRWAAAAVKRYPDLALLFAIPHGGQRHKLVAAKLRAEGVRPGVPDLFLPAPRGPHHGLFVEMKRTAGSAVSAVQKVWHRELAARGYHVVVCRGWEQAQAAILEYLCMTGVA